MFTLTIRDYLKCAHSLKGEIFGPAQLMHVITYEVEAVFTTAALDEYGIIVDFASAQRGLQEIILTMNFRNLDEHPQLRGKNTTTEFLCQWIHGELAKKVQPKFQGELTIVLRESSVAWTTYTEPMKSGPMKSGPMKSGPMKSGPTKQARPTKGAVDKKQKK